MKWLWRGLGLLVVAAFLAILILRVEDTVASEMRAKYGGAPSQFVTLADGTQVHLRDEGPRDAPVILLLHGSNADLYTWQNWVNALKSDYRVIRIDQIGHGLTGPASDADYSRDAFVDDVENVAEALDLDRFVIGGNSMGGWIAAAYALQHPDHVEGLVLVDAAGAPIDQEGSGNLGFTLARIPGVGALGMSILPRFVIERSLSQSVSNQSVVTDAAIDRYWELGRFPGNRAATLKRFATARTPFSRQQMQDLDVPTLILWGEDDALIPVAAAGWFGETIRDSRAIVYDSIGHLPHEEIARSARDVKQFLKQLSATPPGDTEPRRSEPVQPS